MPRVHFTPNLRRHFDCAHLDTEGATLRAALDHAFVQLPIARGYLLEDGGALRKHVTVFVDGEAVADRTGLSDPVPDGADIWVMQALSGG